jgi:hypothetical protein
VSCESVKEAYAARHTIRRSAEIEDEFDAWLGARTLADLGVLLGLHDVTTGSHSAAV